MSEDTTARKRPMSVEESKEMKKVTTGNEGPVTLSSIDPKWRNWWIRGFFTFILVGIFAIFIYMGPLALALMIIGIFIKCFQEIITIGHSKYQEYNLPLFRSLNWYFLTVAVIFMTGSNLIQYYPEFFNDGLPDIFATYHRLVCFSMYIFGFVMFVLTLKKDYYMVQFTLFGWTHLTMFLLGTQVYFVMQNVFEGLFWFLLPVSMVICNDIMAYVFGFFFGKTKLINLSPKKTWEGFIGAFGSTLVWGVLFSYILARFQLACYATQISCENAPMFKWKEYTIPLIGAHIEMYPAMLHSIPLATFASLIAPFGGFFASGFKRAFKIKDFADVIPGHGGLMDRFDCQMLMAFFSNVYYFTFCRAPNIDRVFSMIMALTADQQMEVFEKLQEKFRPTN